MAGMLIIPRERIPEFSWSLRRRRIFHRCRREYFYTYCASGGGYETGCSDEITEKLHLLKGMFSRESYLTRVTAISLAEFFYVDPESELAALAHRRFERELQAMFRGIPEHDHKMPMLWSLILPETPVSSFCAGLKESLKERVGLLQKNLLPALDEIPMECRRKLPSPLPVTLYDLKCFCTPVIAFVSGGILNILEAGAPSDEAALLHRFYAFNTFNRDPDRVRSLCIADSGNLKEFGTNLSVSTVLRLIRQDAEEMESLRRKDGSAAEEDYSPCPERCSHCRFQRVCRIALTGNSGKIGS